MIDDFSWRKVPLDYLERITDDFGIWQHSNGNGIAIKHGYALDDAARALIVAVLYQRWDLIRVYLRYLQVSVQPSGSIVNFFDGDRLPIMDKLGSHDAIAQAYWALSLLAKIHVKWDGETLESLLIEEAKELQKVYRDHASGGLWLRGNCYALLGAVAGRDVNLVKDLVERLKLLPLDEQWIWPEPTLTYANAIYPWALISAGEVERGLSCLRFLNSVCREDGTPSVIGNKGWYPKGGTKALYDQQPIDAAYLIMANQQAYTISNDKYYLENAWFYFSWFWGNNIKKYILIDDDNSVRDGFSQTELSANRGAENIICYLWAQKTLNI